MSILFSQKKNFAVMPVKYDAEERKRIVKKHYGGQTTCGVKKRVFV